MAVNVNSFATMVSNQVAAMQTAASTLVNFGVGSILRALVNANAAVSMWLQSLVLQVLALTRFASSYGSDADSWGADWGFYRLPASVAAGYVTFSRFTPTNTAFIPVGSQVQTADGTQQFQVVADTTNPAYSATPTPGYTIAAGTASLTAKVQSVNASINANVLPGTISVLLTSISGVDYCLNALATAGGANAESDAAFKARFPLFLQSLARGTPAAIQAAILAIQPGMQCQVYENQTLSGTTQPGFLTIIVDDGTGSPSASVLSQAGTIANLYRAAGVQFAIYGPTPVTVNVSFTLTTASGYNHSTLVAGAVTAVTAYIDALLDGASLSYSRLYQVIYDSSAGVIDVTALLVNGGTSDVTPAYAYNVLKAGTVTGV